MNENKEDEVPGTGSSGADDQETVVIPPEPPTQAVTPSASQEDTDELRRKAAEFDGLMDRLKRVTADFQNSQKRIERQAEERVAYAVERFGEELLPVADNLARAIEAAEQAGVGGALLEGVKLVEKQLLDVFRSHGIEMMTTRVGDAFDSNVHEAVAVVPTDKMPPNRIVQIEHHGFTLRKRLLRAARVIVSAAPNPDK